MKLAVACVVTIFLVGLLVMYAPAGRAIFGASPLHPASSKHPTRNTAAQPDEKAPDEKASPLHDDNEKPPSDSPGDAKGDTADDGEAAALSALSDMH